MDNLKESSSQYSGQYSEESWQYILKIADTIPLQDDDEWSDFTEYNMLLLDQSKE